MHWGNKLNKVVNIFRAGRKFSNNISQIKTELIESTVVVLILDNMNLGSSGSSITNPSHLSNPRPSKA